MPSILSRNKITVPRINDSKKADGMTAAEKTRRILMGTGVIMVAGMVGVIVTRRRPDTMQL